MLEKINEKVGVLFQYEPRGARVMPVKMRWMGKLFTFTKLGYYHKRIVGRTRLHIFDVSDSGMDFRLICDPDTLSWTLEEVSDANAS